MSFTSQTTSTRKRKGLVNCVYKSRPTRMQLQWNLSITALQITDTSVIRTVDSGPEQSAIETCTYLTSELRTPLNSVIRTSALPPNGYLPYLLNSIRQKATPHIAVQSMYVVWMASQPPAGTPGIECLEVPSFVRGYQLTKTSGNKKMVKCWN